MKAAMSPTPLPYLSRPKEEAWLRDFLLRRLQPTPGLPKALWLHGTSGAGKLTLLRHVLDSDVQLKAYRYANSETRDSLSHHERSRELKRLVTDIVAPIAGAAHPAAAPVAGVAQALIKHHISRDRTEESALDQFLEGTREPLILIVSGLDPDEPGALRKLGHYINQSRDRALPRALIILDSSAPLPAPDGKTLHPDVSRGLVRIREYLRDDQSLDVLRVSPFSAEQCRTGFQRLGLPAGWANLLHQLSDGRIDALRALWERLQERGIIVPQGRGRWKTLQSASASAGWELVEDHLNRLIENRLTQDTVHKARLLEAFHLAACMGTSFLPQAVAEAVAEADPKLQDPDRRRDWEVIWLQMLESESVEYRALAPRRTAVDGPEIVQADSRRFSVHAFQDPALRNLLRAAARQKWNDSVKPGAPIHQLIAAGRALEAWVQRTFEKTWPRAISFRASLLHMQLRDWEAGYLEDFDYRIRLEADLRQRVELKRRAQRDEEGAGDLYATLRWHAEAMSDLGDFAGETNALREALALVQAGFIRLSTRHHLDLQTDLGLALMAHGAYEEAEPLLVSILQRSIEERGHEDQVTLSATDNLGTLYVRQGRYAKAEPYLLNALSGRERVFGENHPHTLVSVSNLAALHEKQGRHADAERLAVRALKGREHALGRDHVETLLSANNLGYQYLVQRRYDEARPLLLRALRGREQLLGWAHPDTLNSVDNLAHLYLAQGRHSEAEQMGSRALEGRERVLGPDHSDTLTSVHNLAVLYQRMRSDANAESLFRRALDGYGRALGPTHPHTLNSAHSLGLLYREQGRYTLAEPLLVRALEGRRSVLGRGHPSTLTATQSLAGLYFSQGRHAEARRLFSIAL